MLPVVLEKAEDLRAGEGVRRRARVSVRVRVLRAAILFVASAYLISGVRYAMYRPAKSDAYLWVVY
ncbi:MAG: hypothetical protein WA209_08730, partial [Candidatus Acidiferrales bacterium]